MFSGIIVACVPILAIEEKNQQRVFTLQRPPKGALEVGESVNIDGVCSTVIAVSETDFAFSAMPETLRVTTLQLKRVSERVNIEYSLALNDRISGHLVTGHVDAIGTVRSIVQEGDAHLITIDHEKNNDILIVPKGSVALNGVSLTVINPQSGQFSVGIIPYTWENTNFSDLQDGSAINIEYDMIGKYVIHSLKHSQKL